jgi:hypothetical protein
MKHLKVLTALAIGVVASSSGMIQVGAVTYNYFVDFSTKEVADFTAFRQTFNTDTYDLDSEITMNWQGTYRFDSCPTAFTVNAIWITAYEVTGGTQTQLGSSELPNFVCTTTNTSYLAEIKVPLPDAVALAIINDDANKVRFETRMFLGGSAAASGRTMSILGYRNYFDVTYDFNTTYLFNKFLSDHQYIQRFTSGGTWNFTAVQETNLKYVYTTAGNDSYYINNSPSTNIGTTRKKYAIDYNDTFFRGESIGVGFNNSYTGTDTVVLPASGSANLYYRYDYYYLNAANLAQAIVDAPIISFTEEDCSGGFLDVNVGCYVNNALAYIVNDAPVISDAFTLLNTGIELAAQTFGIIGNFSDDNVFGYLILVGFGFIAVKWFLKNDE